MSDYIKSGLVWSDEFGSGRIKSGRVLMSFCCLMGSDSDELTGWSVYKRCRFRPEHS